MKFREIFRFELAYQVRRPWPWLFFAVLLVVVFLMARDAAVADAMYEDFFVNSPFQIAITTVIGTLLWLLLGPVVAGEAGARDVATRMYPLIYTAPVSRTDYLGGRFLAALALNALILLAVPLGIVLAVYSPGVHPEVIGPFRPAAYLTTYGFLALPNAFVATALQFSLAVWSGRTMASYLGSLLLIFMGFFVATLVRFLVMEGLGSLLDPVGINFIVEDLAHQWTTTERKWRLLRLEGTVLRNRLLWVGIALVTLAVTWLRFRFAHRSETAWWTRILRRRAVHAPLPALGVSPRAPITVPHVARTFGFAVRVRQTLAIAATSFRTTATSWAGLALLVAIPAMTVIVVIDQMFAIAVPLIPRTALVLRELTGPLTAELSRWLIIPLLTVFFAGELVWRERDAGVDEMTDATTVPDWVLLLGKFVGLALVLAGSMATLAAAGMLAQIILGYHDFEVGLYLKILFGLQLPEYLLFALLALVVHVLVDQKYVGHLVAIIAYAYIVVLAGVIGIEHNLLVYGSGPAWSYTEMRGFGATIAPWLWFRLYWAAWALLLAVVASLLWARGRESGVGARLRRAHRRFTGPAMMGAAAAAVLIMVLGGFVFHNTNVLNRYVSSSEMDERRAEYERRYRRYESSAQPQLTGTSLRVEIHPARGAVEIRGSHRLVNHSGVPIDTIHVATAASDADTRALSFDRAAARVIADDEHGFHSYALARPLQPGDTLQLDFEVHVERRGFRNRGVHPSVVKNGSYFTSNSWFPFVGYQRFREILSPAARRRHGLEPRAVLASLYAVEGREPAARGGGVAFEAVLGTDADQIAVAPGALRRSWTEGGRRYFHYATDAPIGTEWAFFSAEYAVHEGQWNDVAIRIFHHPEHTAQLDRMMRSVRASLEYYSEQFGPYPYGHLSIVENPAGPGTGAHADPSLISYGQGYAYWIPEGEERFDLPYAVMAHEMAHQWTLPYALVEGLPFLSEGLAWYYGIQLVRASRGEAQLRRLMHFMRQPYPHRTTRRGEPLLRALDPYMAYRKGPQAMFALSEYVGTDRVNRALRRLIEKHDAPGAPQATTLHLYRELQAVTPDSLQYLLHDLFEVNTFWELDTERATAREAADGTWEVTLDVRARKVVYDTAGAATEVPMDEWIQIGVFAAGAPRDELSEPLYVQLHRIRSGTQTITVTVPRRPVLAGIDPYHLLDWEEKSDDDNIDVVTIRNVASQDGDT